IACADCITGFIQQGSPSGQETEIAGLATYAVGDSASSQIVVFGPDVFGWKFNNSRLLADEYASHDFRVLVPDLFGGKIRGSQWTLSVQDPVNKNSSLIQRFNARPLSLSILIPFILRTGQSAQTAKIATLTEYLRREYPEAKIGFVGFCWDGRYVITLNSLFNATVAAYLSQVSFLSDWMELQNLSALW
ncbi:hypothetical protein B0H19DRAFT_1302031, partial [Mycena capillaripes]